MDTYFLVERLLIDQDRILSVQTLVYPSSLEPDNILTMVLGLHHIYNIKLTSFFFISQLSKGITLVLSNKVTLLTIRISIFLKWLLRKKTLWLNKIFKILIYTLVYKSNQFKYVLSSIHCLSFYPNGFKT